MGTIAPSADGRRMATWIELKPLYDVPNMPTRPVHHGWAASQAMTATRSSCSRAGYSSTATPVEEPVPRRSSRHTAYPYSSHSRRYSSA
jgi:hypothetical protein